MITPVWDVEITLVTWGGIIQVIDDKYYKNLALSQATEWHRVALRPLRM
jgi:hypothetical protein